MHTSELGALLAVARPHMVEFFANPPEGLCSGPEYHAAAIDSIDCVIADGDATPEMIRRHAVEQAMMWYGRIIGSIPEGEELDRVAEYDEWETKMRTFPTLRRY